MKSQESCPQKTKKSSRGFDRIWRGRVTSDDEKTKETKWQKGNKMNNLRSDATANSYSKGQGTSQNFKVPAKYKIIEKRFPG